MDAKISYVVRDKKNSHRFLLHGILNHKWSFQFVEIVDERMVFKEMFLDSTTNVHIRNWILDGAEILRKCKKTCFLQATMFTYCTLNVKNKKRYLNLNALLLLRI
jgi:hypothetical protein